MGFVEALVIVVFVTCIVLSFLFFPFSCRRERDFAALRVNGKTISLYVTPEHGFYGTYRRFLQTYTEDKKNDIIGGRIIRLKTIRQCQHLTVHNFAAYIFFRWSCSQVTIFFFWRFLWL